MKQKALYFEALMVLVICTGSVILGYYFGLENVKTKIKSNQPIMVGEFLYRCGEQERLPTLR